MGNRDGRLNDGQQVNRLAPSRDRLRLAYLPKPTGQFVVNDQEKNQLAADAEVDIFGGTITAEQQAKQAQNGAATGGKSDPPKTKAQAKIDKSLEFLKTASQSEIKRKPPKFKIKTSSDVIDVLKRIFGYSRIDRDPMIKALQKEALKIGVKASTINSELKAMDGLIQRHRSIDQNAAMGRENDTVLDKLNPFANADEFLQIHHKADPFGQKTLRYWRGLFYVYNEGQWVGDTPDRPEQDAVFFQVLRWLKRCLADGKNSIEPFKPKPADVSATRLGVAAITRHTGEDEEWIGEPGPQVIPVENGLLNPCTGDLMPHDTRFFSTRKIHGPYVADLMDDDDEFEAILEKTIMPFLRSTFAKDHTQIDALQEAFGYLMFGGTKMQKAFMIIGPPRSGKGTLNNVMKALMGSTVCAPSTRSLSGQFGAQTLLDKRVATITDMRIDKNTNLGDLAELLLKTIGGDPISVERKFLSALDVYLTARFMILSNAIPRLSDPTGVLAQRFVYFETAESHLGKENLDLLDELLEHKAVWIAWALRGFQHLETKGKAARFTASKTHNRLLDSARGKMAPVETFLDRFMIRTKSSDAIDTEYVYLKFIEWAGSVGISRWQKNALNAKIKDLRPGVEIRQREVPKAKPKQGEFEALFDTADTHRVRAFVGLTWKEGEDPTAEQIAEWAANQTDDEDDDTGPKGTKNSPVEQPMSENEENSMAHNFERSTDGRYT